VIQKAGRTWKGNEEAKLSEDRWRCWLLDNPYTSGIEGSLEKEQHNILKL
jgi:hypothetical protein